MKVKKAVFLLVFFLSATQAQWRQKGDFRDQVEREGDGFPSLSSRAEDSPFGVNLSIVRDERELDLAREAGARWIRVLAFWRFLEPDAPLGFPEPGIPGRKTGQHRFNWGELDRAVDAARGRGLEVYLTVLFPPPWANGSTVDCRIFADVACARPATDPGYFEDFMFNLADHFRGRVRYYGIWNEPNLPMFYHPELGPGEDIRNRYVLDLLLPAHRALRAADPEAKLVGPELSLLRTKAGTWDENWFDPLLQHFGDYFDVISLNTFTSSALKLREDVIDRVEQILAAHGLLGKRPFWITEVGWRSNHFGEALQAAFLYRVYQDMEARSHWWKRTFWFTLHDEPDDEDAYGLTFSGGHAEPFRRKLAFRVYQMISR